MYSFDKLKSLSKRTALSLLKEEKPSDLETSDMFDKNEKEQMLFNITDEGKKAEFVQFTNKLNKEQAWKNIIANKKKRKIIKIRPWHITVAASVVVLLCVTYFLNDNDGLQNNTAISVDNNIEIGTDKAILTLEDGSEVALEKGIVYETPHVTSNGEEIVYLPTGQAGTTNQQPTTNNNIVYNTLTIPRGAQFQIKLSDGTQVWLNSESQLKYPIAFKDGDTRQVELVYGEAYFDVSPSTKHQGAKFKVYNQYQEVEVLGTEFNIKAYKGETNIYTTLVEGKVAVNYSGENQILAPNQQFNLDLQNNTISMTTVNAHNETSWKEGVFNFKRKSLKDIMTVLSRWYDMDVVFEDKSLEDLRFMGAFNKSSAIEDILLIIKSTGFVKGYEIRGKVLIIR